MLQTQDLEQLINHIVDLAPPCENDSVVFGFLSLTDNPFLVEAVMQYVTKFYDTLLQSVSLSPINTIILQMERCFTEDEYYTLFNARENSFTKPIFKTLLITNHTDRLLFIRNRTESYEAFLTLLKSWSQVYNPILYSFLYGNNISTAS